jgi:hypothetical protein
MVDTLHKIYDIPGALGLGPPALLLGEIMLTWTTGIYYCTPFLNHGDGQSSQNSFTESSENKNTLTYIPCLFKNNNTPSDSYYSSSIQMYLSTKLCLDKSILVKSIMGQRKYIYSEKTK